MLPCVSALIIPFALCRWKFLSGGEEDTCIQYDFVWRVLDKIFPEACLKSWIIPFVREFYAGSGRHFRSLTPWV